MDPNIDKNLVASNFERAATSYDNYSYLAQEISGRALSLLEVFKISPSLILDIGCGTGKPTRVLAKRYRKAKIIYADIAVSMLEQARPRVGRWFSKDYFVCTDMERLAFPNNRFDLVFSNLVLEWCPNLTSALSEAGRVLKTGGLFLFTTFGPNTLQELRAAFAKSSNNQHVNGFLDMHDIGDLLTRSGFENPVMETDILTVEYQTVRGLLRDLKRTGSTNALKHRKKGLLGTRTYGRVLALDEASNSMGTGVKTTFEVVYGHAWATPSRKTGEYPLLRR